MEPTYRHSTLHMLYSINSIYTYATIHTRCVVCVCKYMCIYIYKMNECAHMSMFHRKIPNIENVRK